MVPTDIVLSMASDNAEAILDGPIDDSTKTITVVNDDTFLHEVFNLVLIDQELILVKPKTVPDGTWEECIRGFAGTTPAAHIDGSMVYAYIFAYHHNQISSELQSIGNYHLLSDMTGFKYSENLIQFSEDFSDASWIKTGDSQVTTSVETLPNGAEAMLFQVGASLAANKISSLPSGIVASSLYTFSIYAKYTGTLEWVALGQRIDGPEETHAHFNIRTGAIGHVGSGLQGKASIVPVDPISDGNGGYTPANGWYRLMVVLYCTTNAYKSFDLIVTDQSGSAADTNSYTGNGTDTIAICGAQVQNGDMTGPMTYIKTTGTSFRLVGSGDLILDEGDLN